jgi:hypothetical protein
MIYAIYVALAMVAFLVNLNGFLRGAQKGNIDIVLSLLLVGLVVTAFIILGWKLGLLAIPFTFISAIATRPLAGRVASSMLHR